MILRSATALCAALALVACGKGSEEKAAEGQTTPPPETAASGAPASTEAPVANAAPFDLSKVPVSTAALGAFPYFTLPPGYTVRDESTMDLAAFPVFTGAGFQPVEGKVYMARSSTEDNKTYSRLEFERAFENAVKAAGGVQVARGEAPSELIDKIPQDQRSDMSLGLGAVYGNPMTTWVVRRADKTIWVHTTTTSSDASWAVIDGPAAPAS